MYFARIARLALACLIVSVTTAAQPAGASGALSGVATPTSSPINLTTLGTSDWAHWGVTDATSFDHKVNGGSQISNYTKIGTAAASQLSNNIGYTWTDGAPTNAAVATATGIFIGGVNNGLSLTAPADTATRTLIVYVGGSISQGTLIAHLSDGSAPDYTATASNLSGSYNQTYTLTYKAGSAGNALTVTWKMTSGVGQVNLQSAALSGTPPPASDFSLSAAPASFTVTQGAFATSTISITPLNGFSGNVTFSASGLPAGVAAAFSPGPAHGTSVVTLTASSTAVIGPVPVTVTGTSGGTTHTVTINLTVVSPQVLTTITINPAFISVIAGTASTPVQARAWDQNGNPMTVQPTFTWSVSGGGYCEGTAIFVADSDARGQFTLTASCYNVSGTAIVLVTDPGAITGSPGSPSSTVNLTAAGVSDWAHWGLTSAASLDHKASGGSQISNYTLLGAGHVATSSSTISYTWTDGTPTSTVSGTTTGISVNGLNSGFSFTVPADTTPRTLLVYVGGSFSEGRLTAHLSDRSCADYTATAANLGQPYNGEFTLVYHAASAGQSLVVTWIADAGSGSVTLQAAALTESTPTPDFSLTASPVNVSVAQGGAVTSNITANALNGFTGAVMLSAPGLRPGITASFSANPTSGTSTITLNAGSNATGGPVTILGISGGMIHTATVNLTVSGPPVLTTIAMEPLGGMVYNGYKLQFTATGLDQNGIPLPQQPVFTWSVSQGGGTITTNGLYTAGSTAGDFLVTVSYGGISASAPMRIFLVQSGYLSGSFAVSPDTVDLTTLGTDDWAHWGLTDISSFDHKAGGGMITNRSLVGSGIPGALTANSIGYTWADGVPTLSTARTATGITASGKGNGFTFETSSDPSEALNQAQVYVGGTNSEGTLTAHLEDNSAPDYTGVISNLTGVYNQVFTLTYAGATGFSPPLSLTWTMTGGTGSVNLQAVTVIKLPPPDYALSISPTVLSVSQGASCTSIVTVVPVNGYVGDAELTLSGLPAGVIPTFSVNPVTATSTMTLTADSTAALGTATVTIRGWDGLRSRTTVVDLTVISSPMFTLSASPNAVNISQGASGTSTITVNPLGGFTAPVTLSASGLPAGVAASFGTNPATAASVLTLSASSTATPGPATVTITGTSGALTHTVTLALAISDFSLSESPGTITLQQGGVGTGTVTITALNGFSGAVTLSATGLPSGVTALCGTNPTTNTSVITLSASRVAAIGLATVTITGVSGAIARTSTFVCNVTPGPDYSLSGSPATLAFQQGTGGTTTVTVTPLYGFSGSVTLSASGLPAGVTAAFGTNPTSGKSVMTFTAASGAATGAATVTITGTSGGLTHTASVLVTILAAPILTTIAVTPAATTVNTGTAQQFSATARDQYGVLLSPQPVFTWSVSGGGLIGSTGLFTAGHTVGGPYTVTAASGAVSGTAAVSLTLNPLIDFNGDGKPDLVLQNTATHQVALWYLTRALLLGGQYVSSALPTGWNVAGQGDFNGDGHPDIVLQNAATKQVAIWYLNGPALLTGQYVSAIPTGRNVVAVGDFNGDGHPDLVLQSAANNQVTFWYLSGAAFLSAQTASLTPASGWNVVAMGDFNGDGKNDLLLQNAASNKVAIWHMTGATVLNGGYISATPPAVWAAVGVGDFNGDGHPDLVMQNTQNNQVAFWYLNDTQLLTGDYVSTTPGAGWKVVGPD